MFDPASCAGYGVGDDDGSGRGINYGLGADPFLAGFNPFKIIAAPFKAGANVVKYGVKTAIKVAPRTAMGFLTAGPAGAAAGAASYLIPAGPEGPPPPDFASTSFVGTPTDTGAVWATTMGPPTGMPGNPYRPEASPYYARPRPAPSFKDQLANVAALLKDELLAQGGRMIAATPEGQRGIREKVGGDIGRYLLPISLGLGGLFLITTLARR